MPVEKLNNGKYVLVDLESMRFSEIVISDDKRLTNTEKAEALKKTVERIRKANNLEEE